LVDRLYRSGRIVDSRRERLDRDIDKQAKSISRDADTLIDKLTDQGVTPVIPRPRPIARVSANAISRPIVSAILSSVSLTRLSTSAALRRAATNLREVISL
jgi:hypothetical protein